MEPFLPNDVYNIENKAWVVAVEEENTKTFTCNIIRRSKTKTERSQKARKLHHLAKTHDSAIPVDPVSCDDGTTKDVRGARTVLQRNMTVKNIRVIIQIYE